jgi:Protein of unknown function (DUF3305)
MIAEQMIVGLVLERRVLGGSWGGVAWRPVTIFPHPPEVAPWTPLGGSDSHQQYYAGEVPISLYSTDTANYRDNLASGMPKLWVVLTINQDAAATPVTVLTVTADPAEGEGNTEAGGNIVEPIDMPPEVAGVVAAFIEAHHVERPVFKRRRDGKGFDERWRDGGPGKGGPGTSNEGGGGNKS